MSPPVIRDRLEHVSPSLYGSLRQWKDGKACGLQMLWTGDPPLAPFPTAKLGSIVHEVMEAVNSGHNQSDVENLWDKKCQKTDEFLNARWVTRGLVPLALTTRGYAMRKKQTIQIASNLTSAEAVEHLPRNQQLGPLKEGHGYHSQGDKIVEERLQTKDGLIRGKIDLAEKRNGIWVLVDYKSGAVMEVEDGGKAQIKEDHQLQLMLYAHLLKEAKGIEVQSASIMTLDGKCHVIPMDAEKVRRTAREARQLLGEFNQLVPRSEEALYQFATPLPNSPQEHVFGCMGCHFRIKCKAYIDEPKTSEDGKFWPKDMIGEIESIQEADDKLCIRLVTKTANKNKNLPILVLNSKERHPALCELTKGDWVGIFDHVAGRTTNYDGPRTCLYKMAN